MMNTVLNLGLTVEAERGLATETGDPQFAARFRLQFLSSFASAITETGAASAKRLWPSRFSRAAAGRARHRPRDPSCRGARFPTGGTAVTVQTMMFGHRDRHSGIGACVQPQPDRRCTDSLRRHSVRKPGRGSRLRPVTHVAAPRAGRPRAVGMGPPRGGTPPDRAHYRDSCCIEFTFETGQFWILQVHRGKMAAAVAPRVAVDLVDEGVSHPLRGGAAAVTPHHLRHARIPRMVLDNGSDVLARGQGACPGVAVGRVATSSDKAVRMAAHGPVILVRPDTSPLDMHGLAAASGVLTGRGTVRTTWDPAPRPLRRVRAQANVRRDDRSGPARTSPPSARRAP